MVHPLVQDLKVYMDDLQPAPSCVVRWRPRFYGLFVLCLVIALVVVSVLLWYRTDVAPDCDSEPTQDEELFSEWEDVDLL